MSKAMDEISFQILWSRLVSVVEEQAQTLVRTAFSTAAREAGDISAGVFDVRGRMIAQAVTGTPGHVNSMARSVAHFLNEYPSEALVEGDVLITNDPWKATGHLFDLTVVSPVFYRGRLVAFFACTAHVVDIGGIGPSADGRQIYHEGLQIPIMKLARAGVMNEDLLKIVRQNVREPVQVVGDIFALAACNDTGATGLTAMMADYGLEDMQAVSDEVIERSRRAMLDAFAKLPRGSWSAEMTIDGYEAPVHLCAKMTIGEDRIVVDFEGTSGLSSYAINCPMSYTEAYVAFGLKAALAPWVPNNTGTLDVIEVVAPENCIVNALPPAAVYTRSAVGQMMPDLVFGCLDQALPGVVPAEGSSGLWTLTLTAGHGVTGVADGKATPFNVATFHSGGAGARPHIDGLSTTPFPSGVRNVPVEITESITPLVIWTKEYRTDSGGAGKQRGGLGQRMVISSRENAPFGLSARYERAIFPARGRQGGKDGQVGKLSLASGISLKAKGFHVIPVHDRLVVEMPGGGGYGDPAQRDPEEVVRDVAFGYITPEEAQTNYGVPASATKALTQE